MLAWAALAGACSGNGAATLRALELGNVDDTPATRTPPDEMHRARCGDGAPTRRGRRLVHRTPYVQRVTPHAATVMWTTAERTPQEVVVFRPGGSEVARVEAEVDPTARLGTSPQFRARIRGLEPATLYCYELRAGGRPLFAPIGLRTAPRHAPDGEGREPVRFVVFGDSGEGSAAQMGVTEQLRTVPFDLMLHTGDIAYPKGTMSELETLYFDIYEHLLRSFPMYPASGNHDYLTEDAAPYREVFELPPNGDAPDERWYSFDWGPVHFVALDTQRVGERQAAWLDRDLRENDRPWVVVYGHRPPFSSGSHGSEKDVREHFAPVLERQGAQLMLSGHDHHYERSRPIAGVTYVVTGGGGRGTRGTGASSFTAFSLSVAHFVYGEVHDDRLELHAIDAVGKEFDSVTIPRGDGA